MAKHIPDLSMFTLGVEEEYQIVDPTTRELRSHISTMLEEGGHVLGDAIKAEMHQSVIEVGTGICKNVTEARADVCRLRAEVANLAKKNGLRIVAASTHPFSDWKDQSITDRERYHMIVEDLQDVARGNLIFGLHVHVGIPDRDLAIELFNERHMEEYGHIREEEMPEIVGVRLATYVDTAAPAAGKGFSAAKTSAPVAKIRRANLGAGYQETNIHHGADLKPGHEVMGPAIIEETFTTIVVYPGWKAEVDDAGDYELTRVVPLH